MKQELKQKINITEIAEEIKKEGSLEMYWDYNDKLSDEQVIKIITDEDGLYEVQDEIYDNNIDYIYEIVADRITSYCEENDLELTEEEQEDLKQLCEENFDFNINGLLRNSETRMRLTLNNNYDIVSFNEYRKGDFFKNIKKDFVVKEFMRVFKGKYNKADFEEELNNVFDYGNFTFYFKVSGEEILKLREQILKGFIELREGLSFGLFDNFNGSGSLMEMELTKSIKLNLKDWRFMNDREEILNGIENKYTDVGYWKVSINGDSEGYGLDEVYGLSGESWKEW